MSNINMDELDLDDPDYNGPAPAVEQVEDRVTEAPATNTMPLWQTRSHSDDDWRPFFRVPNRDTNPYAAALSFAAARREAGQEEDDEDLDDVDDEDFDPDERVEVLVTVPHREGPSTREWIPLAIHGREVHTQFYWMRFVGQMEFRGILQDRERSLAAQFGAMLPSSRDAAQQDSALPEWAIALARQIEPIYSSTWASLRGPLPFYMKVQADFLPINSNYLIGLRVVFDDKFADTLPAWQTPPEGITELWLPAPTVSFGYQSFFVTPHPYGILRLEHGVNTTVGSPFRVPFLAFEVNITERVGAGHLRARLDGAAMVTSMHRTLADLDDEEPLAERSVAYTAVLEAPVLTFYIHWREVDPNGGSRIHFDVFARGLIDDARDVVRLREASDSIFRWAMGRRLADLRNSINSCKVRTMAARRQGEE